MRTQRRAENQHHRKRKAYQKVRALQQHQLPRSHKRRTAKRHPVACEGRGVEDFWSLKWK